MKVSYCRRIYHLSIISDFCNNSPDGIVRFQGPSWRGPEEAAAIPLLTESSLRQTCIMRLPTRHVHTVTQQHSSSTQRLVYSVDKHINPFAVKIKKTIFKRIQIICFYFYNET